MIELWLTLDYFIYNMWNIYFIFQIIMETIVEWGHFYLQEWFSTESKEWWELTNKLSKVNWNESMLFIDDIHEVSFSDKLSIIPVKIDLSKLTTSISEKAYYIIEQVNINNWVEIDINETIIDPNHILLESEMSDYTNKVIDILHKLPKRKKVRFRNWKWWFCSNIKVIHANSTPTCVWYDLWLTLLKEELWFKKAINVLPISYEEQQACLKRIYKKVNPEFSIEQIYHNQK